jgi:hypothetical protein
MLQEGLLLIDAGYAEASAANIERFLRSGSWVETLPEQIALRVVQAWAEMLSGRTEAALEHARFALGAETGPLIVALTGTIFARCGAVSLAKDALRIASQFDDIPLYRFARFRTMGALALAEGRQNDALRELRNAAALEPPIAHRQYLIEALPRGSRERRERALHALRYPWQNLRPPLMHHIGATAIAISELDAADVARNRFATRFTESSQKLTTYL